MHRTPLPARLLRQRLVSLLEAMPAATAGDVTSVHRARVASRRLREVLPVLAEAAAEPAALDRAGKQVRRITRALGPIRELDVALGHLDEMGPRAGVSARALALARRHLNDERNRHRRAMLEKITPATLKKLQARLHGKPQAPPASGPVPEAELQSARRRTSRRARALETAVGEASHLYVSERLHAARVAAKKLRYAMEVERELTRSRAVARINQLKKLQDALGLIHDYEVLAERIRETQGALASTDRPAVTELDRLVRALEEACREGHAAFVKQRDAIVALCHHAAAGGPGGRMPRP